MTDTTPRDIIDIPVGGPGDPLNSPNHIDSHRIAKNELQYLSDRTEPALRNISGLAPPGGPGIQTYSDQSGEVWVGLNGGPWRRARDVLNLKYTRAAPFTVAGPRQHPHLLPWDTLIYDPFTIYSPASGLLTCPVAGIYLVRQSYLDRRACRAGGPHRDALPQRRLTRCGRQRRPSWPPSSSRGSTWSTCAAGDSLATWLQLVGRSGQTDSPDHSRNQLRDHLAQPQP